MAPDNNEKDYAARNVAAVHTLAGRYADLYLRDFLIGPISRFAKVEPEKEAVLGVLHSPFQTLGAFFGHYAFARRGREREDVASVATTALARAAERIGEQTLIESEDAAQLWAEFVAVCEERGLKPREEQNRGTVQGILELAQEIHRLYPGTSLATWIVKGLREHQVLEPEYERIVDIRGIGPKAASTFVRDTVVLFDLEELVSPAERIYTLAVDRWLRKILPLITNEPGLEDVPDWIVAGKVAKYTRLAKAPASRFDMGVTFFGQRIVVREDRFEREFARLTESNGGDKARLV
ncbi:MAG: hypothetical protein IT207_11185 [Fimbriimonadaceae bacterium]|nr:hypothetical protein [Fimbriimonadaceae bacterium]